jgi:hypothetical protein
MSIYIDRNIFEADFTLLDVSAYGTT